MFDEISNYVIFLIPLAIFIGRIFLQAKSRNASRNEPRIEEPVIYDEEEDDFMRRLSGKGTADRKPQKKPSSTRSKKAAAAPEKSLGVLGSGNLPSSGRSSPATAARKVPVRSVAGVASASGAGFAKLASLSPLKQAVIMAEVLGPPKGMQDL